MTAVVSNKIIGSGMIAKSIEQYRYHFHNFIVFASGVSDSTCTNRNEFNREIEILHETIKSCFDTGNRIVYFSSAGAVYGDCNEQKKEDSSLEPVNEYGYHKIICENLIKLSGIEYLILRVPNVVGLYQSKKQLVPHLVDKAFGGKAELQKNATRDLIDVSDLAKLTVSIVRKVDSNEIINLASGLSIPVIDIFNEIQNILGTNAHIEIHDEGIKHNFSIEKLKKYINTSFAKNYWKMVLRKHFKEKLYIANK